MKKRLLALVLCFVMMTSLLPLSTAALGKRVFKFWNMDGTVELSHDGIHYLVNIDNITFSYNDTTEVKTGGYFSNPITTDPQGTQYITDSPVEGTTYYVEYSIMFTNGFFETEWDDSFTANLEIPGYETKCIGKNAVDTVAPWLSFYFSLTKKHEHAWQFTQTENSLTATCTPNCPIGEASLTLDAHSVTLPDSPFNAQVLLNGITEQQIKDEFGYTIGPIRYKYKAPGDSAFTEITPADGAREGTYQASVTLSPLYAQTGYALNEDGTANQGPIMAPDGSVTLYTQYTAVNPEVTAQTGDNRPIELMMAGVAVFSALAAAAFILDSKRKYSR